MPFVILLFCSLYLSCVVHSQVIRNIYIDQLDVFDSTSGDWFFAAPLANALHSLTRSYIIEDELMIVEGDTADPDIVLEIERNLRRTGLFSSVNVRTQPVGANRDVNDSVDMYIVTQDRFSLRPAVIYGTGGGITNIGFKLEESNLFGTATAVGVQAIYRTENDIGWEGMVKLNQRRLFRTELWLEAALQSNRFRTEQLLQITKPYRTTLTPWAFGLGGANRYGNAFAYPKNSAPMLLPFHDRELRGWISQSYGDADLLFVSAAVGVNDVNRTLPESRQAFDNTGHILISFSSLQQEYRRSVFLDGYETEDLMEGGWGNAILGRVFSLGKGGQTMWYIGGEAEKSIMPSEKVYLFGQIQGASGFGAQSQSDAFSGTVPLYTFVGVQGIAHWRLHEHVVLATRLRTQTVWNWNAFHQLVLDFEAGLRGYAANQLTGDNRAVGNVEARWFPGWRAWVVGFSAVAFYDVGTAWNQGVSLTSVGVKHAIGLGFRIHNLKASGSDAIFRFDFAYNLQEGRFGGFIFSTNQLFSALGRHQYRPPQLLGIQVDER